MGGRKVWTEETLSVPDLQEYLQDQSVMKFASAGARTAGLASPQAGDTTWLDDVKALEVYDGTTWRGFDTAPTAWVPVLGSTGTAMTQGDKTLWSGSYARHGRTVTAQFQIMLGSGFAAGTGTFELTPPLAAAALTAGQTTAGGLIVGTAWLWSSTTFVAVCRLKSNGRIEFLHHGSTGSALAGPTAPFTWAAPHQINGSVTYRTA